MADELSNIRDFFNNPYPPVKASTAKPVASKLSEQEVKQEAEVGEIEPVTDPQAHRRNQGEFSITDNGDFQDVYFTSPSGMTTKIGGSANTQNKEILDRLAIEYSGTGNWNAPNDVVEAVKTGVLGSIDYIGSAYNRGVAEQAASGVGRQAMMGEIPFKDAYAKRETLLHGTFAVERPVGAWEESKLGGFLAYSAYGVGQAAKMTPNTLGAMSTGAKTGMILAMGAEGMAFLAGSVVGGPTGGAALAAAVMPAAAAMGNVGMAYGMIEYSMNVEGGNMALDMYGAGFEESTIKVVAPIAGAVSGVLEVYGMKFLSGGMSSKAVSKVMLSQPVQKFVKNKLVSYGVNVGGETGTEVLQTLTEQVTRELSAKFENKPELMVSRKDRFDAIVETVYAAFYGSLFLAAPGSMMGTTSKQSKSIKANVEKVKLSIAEGEKRTEPLKAKTLVKQILGEENKSAVKEVENIDALETKSDNFEYGEKHAMSEETLLALEAEQEAVEIQLQELMGDQPVTEANFKALPIEEQTEIVPILDKKASLNMIVEGVQEGKKMALKVEDPLTTEAKKYKTADEFVKSQGVVYHGTTEDFTTFKPEDFGEYGVHEYFYFAKDKRWVKKFGEQEQVGAGKFKIKAFKVSVENPVDLTNKSFTVAQWISFFEKEGIQLSPTTKKDWVRRSSESPKLGIAAWQLFRHDRGSFRKDLKEAGHDGILMSDVSRGKTDNTVLIAFDTSQIKTEAELKDIWKKAQAKKPKTPKPLIPGIKDKVFKAKEAKLKSDIKGVKRNVKDLEDVRKRFMNLGVPYKALSNKINKLRGEATNLESQLANLTPLFKEQAVVKKREKLEFTPISIKNIVEVARKAGAKLSKARATMVKEVGSFWALTSYDLKKLMGNNKFELMTDLEFKNFLDGVKKAAGPLAERKQALLELRQVMSDKEFIHAENLRKFNELPIITKMTAEQINEFVELLEGFEKGDAFWSPKAMAAISRTKWEGAQTKREVIEKAGAEYGVPVEDILSVEVAWTDRFKFDYLLSKTNPLYKIALAEIEASKAKAQMKWTEFRGKLFELGKKALASRGQKLSTWEQVLRKVASIQPEVMAYIEATGDRQIEAGAKLTPEELEFANTWIEFSSVSYEYLVRVHALESRFAKGGYITHTKRGIPELFTDVLRGKTGVKAAFQEVLDGWKEANEPFTIADAQGKILSKEKFFAQSLFRSGKLTPSQSMIEVMDSYARQFYSKVAFDEAIPTIETVMMSLSPSQALESDKIRMANLRTFMKQMMNTKKGQRIDFSGVIPQGGVVDAAIKLGTNLMGIMYIAWNYKLQLASVVGEQIPVTMLLGLRGRRRANARRITAKGQKIIAKYKHFTGDSAIDIALQPGKSVADYARLTMYGIFQQNRALVMQELLLGNMTKEEFESETISDEKLAEIKIGAGRWMDVALGKSILGSTSVGTSINQFKTWAIPMARTMAEDALALSKAVGTLDGNKISKQQLQELYRIAYITSAVVFAYQVFGDPEENKEGNTWTLRAYILREMGSLPGAIQVVMSAGPGILAGFLARLSVNLGMLATLAEAKSGKNKGKLKGLTGLKRQFTPSSVRPFLKKDTKKSKFKGIIGGPSKSSFKGII